MPALARTAPGGFGELPGPVAGQEPEVRGAAAEVHQEVADLLGGPRPVRVGGHAEDVHGAGAGLDHEQAVQAVEGICAVHVEEVGGQYCRSLGAQELPPRRVGVPFRRRGDLQCFEDPADRGGAGPVAELEQLTLVVLGGEALDERGDLGADRRPSRAVRVGPLLSDQPAVPPRDGAWVTSRCARSLRDRCRISAARTARSAQSSRGWGLVRRSTATSCRSTSSSAFFPSASGRPGQASHRAGRRSDRAGEGTRLIIMPHGHASPAAPGQE
jgi:hypothetical protein